MSTTNGKYPLALATQVASGIMTRIQHECEPGFCVLTGSARRERPEVGDVEILYVSKCEARVSAGDMFETPCLLAEWAIDGLVQSGILRKRLNVDGKECWGPQNKLAEHVATGVAVDLFRTTKESWWNYLVCRTGPAVSNEAIAKAARARGWKWEPYSNGFVLLDQKGEATTTRAVMKSEREVFDFVGLNYLEPRER